jgi:hypothetical protein
VGFRGGNSPRPYSSLWITTTTEGAGYHKVNAMAKKVFPCGENFKVRELLSNFLKIFRNFIRPVKLAF